MKNFIIVLASWLTLAFFLIFGLSVTLKTVRLMSSDQHYEENIWLPPHYIQANKLADGSYMPLESVSLHDTSAYVSLEAFQKLVKQSSENKVFVETSPFASLLYTAKMDGVTYYAILQPESKSISWLMNTVNSGARIIADNRIEWLMEPNKTGGIFLLTLFWIVFVAVSAIWLQYYPSGLIERTKKIFGERRFAIEDC